MRLIELIDVEPVSLVVLLGNNCGALLQELLVLQPIVHTNTSGRCRTETAYNAILDRHGIQESLIADHLETIVIVGIERSSQCLSRVPHRVQNSLQPLTILLRELNADVGLGSSRTSHILETRGVRDTVRK